MAADSTIVLLPRYTTLCGATTFTTLPLDVSRFGSVQFQLWRGPQSSGTFKAHIEESLDAEKWAPGAGAPVGIDPGENFAKLFSYSFLLRWFRLRVVLTGTDPRVMCWAEGLLR
jgi:hypothetical protein